MKPIRIIIIVIDLIAATLSPIVLLQNTDIVNFHILFWTINISQIMLLVLVIIISFSLGYFIKEIKIKRKPEVSNKDAEREETKFEKKYSFSIVTGAILLIAGLIITIIHKDIAVEIVGKEQALKEAFFGGSSFKQAVIIVLGGGIAGIVSGVIFLFYGLISFLKKN